MTVLATYAETNVDADAVIGDIGDAELDNGQGFKTSINALCSDV